MPYSINELAKLAGISVRTLHHYDAVGLLKPARVKANGYRQYDEHELLVLQQILFFRELEFPLEEIKRIITAKNFDMQAALRDQRKLIELKKKRLTGLIGTIDATIKKIKNETYMEDRDLYGEFTKEKMDEYAAEAKQRWGNTDAYKQSQEHVKNMTREDFARIQKAGDELMREIVEHMKHGPESEVVQKLIAKHYDGLRTFYEPNLEIYRGLAEMYVADERFTAFYEKYAKGLAWFMHDAMIHFVETKNPRR